MNRADSISARTMAHFTRRWIIIYRYVSCRRTPKGFLWLTLKNIPKLVRIEILPENIIIPFRTFFNIDRISSDLNSRVLRTFNGGIIRLFRIARNEYVENKRENNLRRKHQHFFFILLRIYFPTKFLRKEKTISAGYKNTWCGHYITSNIFLHYFLRFHFYLNNNRNWNRLVNK